MASHFVSALGITSLNKMKKKLHSSNGHTKHTASETTSGVSESEEVDEFAEEFDDVDMSMDTKASAEDTEAMQEALLTTFDAGDVVGKLMAFIAQLRSSSEVTREYLSQICTSLGYSPLEIKLWVRTRWGSLSDCFETVLTLQKVYDYFLVVYEVNTGP